MSLSFGGCVMLTDRFLRWPFLMPEGGDGNSSGGNAGAGDQGGEGNHNENPSGDGGNGEDDVARLDKALKSERAFNKEIRKFATERGITPAKAIELFQESENKN